ncbi:hypothetical protein ACHAXT_012043 [Thalassiosira profunda]
MDCEATKLARSFRWTDQFFEREEGLVAVFDFDYDKIAAFRKDVACVSLLFPPVLVCSALFCWPCFFRQQIDWDVHSQHVAVTRDGIKYVKERRKTGCGLGCQDAGRVSKTVPFDKITDCDVTEAAGATCCCVENVLSVVNVDTASSGGNAEGGPRHELTLAGLKEADKFKQLVWAMKRAGAKGQAVATAPTVAPPAMAMDRGGEGGGNEETNEILRDIRRELVELNANIKGIKE